MCSKTIKKTIPEWNRVSDAFGNSLKINLVDDMHFQASSSYLRLLLRNCRRFRHQGFPVLRLRPSRRCSCGFSCLRSDRNGVALPLGAIGYDAYMAFDGLLVLPLGGLASVDDGVLRLYLILLVHECSSYRDKQCLDAGLLNVGE